MDTGGADEAMDDDDDDDDAMGEGDSASEDGSEASDDGGSSSGDESSDGAEESGGTPSDTGTDGAMDACDGTTEVGCAPGCSGGSFEDRGYAFCSVPSTWAGARDVCAEMGYDLAVIDDDAENAYVSERLVALTGDELGSWIGASDLQTEGTWVWLDGTDSFWEGGPDGQGRGFAPWGIGEPNEGLAGEDCAILLAGFQVWNDLSCTQSRTYACEAP